MMIQEVQEQLASDLERRRLAITKIKRVVQRVSGTTLENTAALMAIPLLYAHIEGFAKESLQHYIEFLEAQRLLPQEVHPSVLGFSLKRYLKTLSGNQSVEKVTEFVRKTLGLVSSPISFAEKTIDTKSNLKFSVLEDLCCSLSIDVGQVRDSEKHLNALVNRRNNIAHGGREQELDYGDVEELADQAVRIMEAFEQDLAQCITSGGYLRRKEAISGLADHTFDSVNSSEVKRG